MTALRRGAAACALMVVTMSASTAWAGPPTEALRHSIDGLFAVVNDPTLKNGARAAERQRALSALAETMVDFGEAARRTLGATWDGRTPAERAHFVRLFADLIKHAYLARIATLGVRIAYDEEIAKDSDVVVRVRAFDKRGDATPVAFAMRQGHDGQWRVFDVSFSGLSLVGTYHAQFDRVIRTASYDELLSRLEKSISTDTGAMNDTAP